MGAEASLKKEESAEESIQDVMKHFQVIPVWSF
jgi:hypothetical protein